MPLGVLGPLGPQVPLVPSVALAPPALPPAAVPLTTQPGVDEATKREIKGARIEEQKTDHGRSNETSTSFHFHGSKDLDGFKGTIGKAKDTILHCFLCSLCLSRMSLHLI